ncbi:hypothetical protein A9R05_43085 (plasmid) [Burkholderia sp. KK1]|uniref:Transglutaminase-like domain-containing protein n=1 Tax=Burkholderia sp. M701 TaxID=326454 RepID=V5YQ29_9BURK|nr:hypothetical protein [Burkholderia sp. M701]AQH05804.1 hypothetical protein A9R05_43085 [Burkholderia sp. KK1]BAO19026.1 hypothetical protein [Burkholderia sp. M701]
MGEAKRKKALAERQGNVEGKDANDVLGQIDQKVNLQRVATAIRKLSEASSANIGRDCHLHAGLCQALLARLGIETTLVIGYAAWRVGNGDGDVINHFPVKTMVEQPKAHPYHAWLEFGNPTSRFRIILDFTTYQLRRKAAELDALDGGHTTVEWCPEYLAVPFANVSSVDDVRMLRAGLFYYERDVPLERQMLAQSEPPDQEDVDLLGHIYQNPEINVIGTNHVSGISIL